MSVAAPVAARDGTTGGEQAESIDSGAAMMGGGELDVTHHQPSLAPNKRPRMSSEPSIFDLPDALLLQITAHLSHTSRMMLGVALTASSSSLRKSNYEIQPSEATKTIFLKLNYFSSSNPHVCFAASDEVEKDFMARLSDEDVGGVLACNRAVHGPIKSVNLPHCIGITGRGLEPLRGSTSLEYLHLRLANGNESPDLSPPSKLDVEAVLPILHSIVDAKGSSLVYFDLPKTWLGEQRSSLAHFLEKFNRAMNSRQLTCWAAKEVEGGEVQVCGKVCRGTPERPWVGTSGEHFGEFAFSCYSCDRTFCADCTGECLPEVVCQRCQVKCCKQCSKTLKCSGCGETSCHECTYVDLCDTCNGASCCDCEWLSPCSYCYAKHCANCMIHYDCEYPGCYTSNCADCYDDEDGFFAAKACVNCGGTYCGDHLMVEHIVRGADAFCSDCNVRAASALSWCNKIFEDWVMDLESRYGVNGKRLVRASESFSDLLEQREHLRQRCAAVGDKLPFKQKQFEKFDAKIRGFEKQLHG